MLLGVLEQFFVGGDGVFPELFSFLFTAHFGVVKRVVVADVCVHAVLPHFVVVVVSDHDVVHLLCFLNILVVLTGLVVFNLFEGRHTAQPTADHGNVVFQCCEKSFTYVY